MTLYVNGEACEHEAATVEQLVEVLNFPGATLLIEHNGTALRRPEWSAARLSPGDKLEILRIAAGG
jgi:sulfur carrier protein